MRDLRKAPGGRNSISAPPKSQTQADGMSSFGRRSSREENAPMTSSGTLMQSNVWQIGALRVGRGSSPVRESSEKGMNSSRSTASGTLRRLNVKANTIQAPIMYQSGLPTLALPYMLSSSYCTAQSPKKQAGEARMHEKRKRPSQSLPLYMLIFYLPRTSDLRFASSATSAAGSKSRCGSSCGTAPR